MTVAAGLVAVEADVELEDGGVAAHKRTDTLPCHDRMKRRNAKRVERALPPLALLSRQRSLSLTRNSLVQLLQLLVAL